MFDSPRMSLRNRLTKDLRERVTLMPAFPWNCANGRALTKSYASMVANLSPAKYSYHKGQRLCWKAGIK
jgi:hypothetical protein